ncbi:PIR Superfamily Protein [Plasmodium ovale wallikeri]|uniref:PIR Superfamily Protein n=1 Tax=Plasmodium ovale wallikeri TaxID=864142 RepID=A0A1A8Z6D1_PLAOA|nr:PIR Superfamily Protein [Plasmodium ovale wallikeri]SBT39987.1 PIR Superfamily Protein [Plasmodium ovale wallikeri]
MLVRKLRELSRKGENYSENRCGHFTHWIYGEIKRKFSNDDNYLRDVTYVNILLDVGYNINNKLSKNCCLYNYNRDASFKEMREVKDLHDFFLNFDRV